MTSDLPLMCSDMACVGKGSHGVTCHQCIYPQLDTPQPQIIAAFLLISHCAEVRTLSWSG